MTPALQKLARAIAELDLYDAPPDTTPVMLDHNNCAYELVDVGGTDKCLTLGDLRAILAEAKTVEDL